MKFHVTERRSFKHCIAQWKWKNVHQLQLKQKHYGNLWFGTGIHKALAEFYQNSYVPEMLPSTMSQCLINNFEAWFNSEIAELGDIENPELAANLEKWSELGYEMMKNYGLNPHPIWENVIVEKPLQMQVEENILVGTPDLYVMQDNHVFVVDHKGYKTFADPETLAFDDQLTCYMLLWNANNEQFCNRGILNQLRKKIPCIPPTTYNGTKLSKAKNIDTMQEIYLQTLIENNFDITEYTDILEHIKNTYVFFRRDFVMRTRTHLQLFEEQLKNELNVMRLFGNETLQPIYNFTSTCVNGCDFYDLCNCKFSGGCVQSIIDENYQIKPPQYGTEMEEE